MVIRVLIENEAGSRRKNSYDAVSLVHLRSEEVSHPYPFPYGFVLGTAAADGDCVDCFVITERHLAAGETIECVPIGLMEQVEDGQADHNVLARLIEEDVHVSADIRGRLTVHVVTCFQHIPGKEVRVGEFLGAAPAQAHVAKHGGASTGSTEG